MTTSFYRQRTQTPIVDNGGAVDHGGPGETHSRAYAIFHPGSVVGVRYRSTELDEFRFHFRAPDGSSLATIDHTATSTTVPNQVLFDTPVAIDRDDIPLQQVSNATDLEKYLLTMYNLSDPNNPMNLVVGKISVGSAVTVGFGVITFVRHSFYVAGDAAPTTLDNTGIRAAAAEILFEPAYEPKDVSPPTITPLTPADGETDVAKTAKLIFSITDGTSVDFSTIQVYVRGQLVFDGSLGLFSPGWESSVYVANSGNGFTFTLCPSLQFQWRNRETVEVFVRARDGEALLAEKEWSFTAAGSPVGGIKIYDMLLRSIRRVDEQG